MRLYFCKVGIETEKTIFIINIDRLVGVVFATNDAQNGHLSTTLIAQNLVLLIG